MFGTSLLLVAFGEFLSWGSVIRECLKFDPVIRKKANIAVWVSATRQSGGD
jgi:hypothetical protein